jgi:hypothetical protein
MLSLVTPFPEAIARGPDTDLDTASAGVGAGELSVSICMARSTLLAMCSFTFPRGTLLGSLAVTSSYVWVDVDAAVGAQVTQDEIGSAESE